jgi:hypothetical protein
MVLYVKVKVNEVRVRANRVNGIKVRGQFGSEIRTWICSKTRYKKLL